MDIVDVHVTSQTNRVDMFSDHPLLDGSKQYSILLNEFCSPLGNSAPLQFEEEFDQNLDTKYLFKVFRRNVGIVPDTAHCEMTGLLDAAGNQVFQETDVQFTGFSKKFSFFETKTAPFT